MRCIAARVEQRAARRLQLQRLEHTPRQAEDKKRTEWRLWKMAEGKVFKCVKLVEEDNWETVVGWARDFRRDVVE